MKKYSLIITIVFCAIALAAVPNPIGNPTVPPSSTRSGLVRSPSPIALNGNLVVTGQVRGGKEFRGFVPYSADTELSIPTASSGIEPFLRQSALPLSGSQQYLPQPYYQPSRTVSSLSRGGTSGLITYPSIKATGGINDLVYSGYVTQPVGVVGRNLAVINLPYEYTLSRPLSYTSPVDLEKLVSYGLISQQEQKSLMQTLEEEKVKEQPQQKKESKVVSHDINVPSVPQPIEPAEQSFQRIEPLKKNMTPDEIALANKNKSVYEQMLEQTGAPVTTQVQGKKPKEANEPNEGGMGGILVIEKETAEAVKGVYKTFAVRSNDKFNYYMRSAEEFLKQGQYYRAADAYTLANIYKPGDPLAYAGRAHALFASGEYMSSAYYLMMAINIFPQYADVKIDLNVMIPDKDKLQNRISDINKWIEKTKSSELEFLLAYIYHQLDRHNDAKKAIDSAAEKMPDNKAVLTLKQAIEK